MVTSICLSIGSFKLDDTNKIAISDISRKVAKAISQADLAKSAGSIIPVGKRKNITVQFKGTIIGTSYDNLESNLDALQAAMESEAEQKLTLATNRFLMVQYNNFSISHVQLSTFASFSFDVIASDPFWYSETLSGSLVTPSSGVPWIVANNGNAPTRVKVTITKTGSGDVVNDILFENSTTGEAFEYRGTLLSGKSLVVNKRVDDPDETVKNNGADAIADWDGDFITLNPGDNTLVFTGTAGIQVTPQYREAWY